MYALFKGIKEIHPEWKIYCLLPEEGSMAEVSRKYVDRYEVITTHWWLTDIKPSLFRKLGFALKMIRDSISVCKILSQIRPDYCITNTVVVPVLAFASKVMRIPHCWFIHEIPQLTWSLHFVFGYRQTYSIIDRLSCKVFVPSVFTKEFYADSIARVKIVPLTQAVEISMETHLSAKDTDSYTLLMVGAIEPNKCQKDLIEAMDMLVKEGERKIKCIFVGRGGNDGYKEECEQLVAGKKLSQHIEFVGYTENVASYYARADVVVVCSKMETFGRTVAEARLYGLPVIAASTGALPEQIRDGTDGLLYEYGNVEELAGKIGILGNPDTRKRFSRNIPADIKEYYSPRRFAEDFVVSIV